MSRSNPFKQRRRQAKRTLLVFGEGLSEEMFFKHLRALYSRDVGLEVTVKKGKGGSPIGIVIDADRTPGDFDRKIVILDNDKGSGEMERGRQAAQEKGIELIENTPCLEFCLLSILGYKNLEGKTSTWCKKEFEHTYISEKRRADMQEYIKIFPKSILDAERSRVVELELFIKIMEGIDSE